MDLRNFVGARWWTFDFHSHTPASSDYGKGPNQAALKNITPEDWLLCYMRARIDCVAVTDHNSGSWIDRLKSALDSMRTSDHHPLGYRPLTIFPGVEITANGGTHVLAIFSPEACSSDIDRLLGAVNYRGTAGESDLACDSSVIDVISAISRVGAVPILAHADAQKGAFELAGNTLRGVIAEPGLAAIEMTSLSSPRPAIYRDSGRTFSEIVGSDSHHPNGSDGQRYPGSHYTWVKMEAPSLEGLSLALLDGAPLSIRRSDGYADNQNKLPTQMIESIEISNAYRCGRGQPLLARFSPWLTTLVGGRGSGKSTIVGMIRIGLHREDEIPANLKKEFSDFKRIAGNRTESGMLLPNTSVKIVYHKDGASFLIEWNYGDDTRTISQIGSNGAIISVPGDIRSRFPIRIFSQKQIFTMAENSDALLQTIDDSEYINFTEWKLRWDKEERHYLSLNAQIRESEIALSEKGRILGELDDTNRKLALFEESHHSVTLTKFQLAQRQIQVLDEWRERWVGAESQIRSIAEAMNLFGVDATDFSSHESETDLSGLSLIEIAHTELKGISELLNELAERTSSNRTKWEKSIEESKWASSVADQTSEYKDLIDRLQQEGVDDVGHHELLIKKKQRLQGSLNSLSEIETSVSSLRNQSIDSVAKMKALRKEITQKRIDFLQTILGDNSYIKIEVAPYQPDVLALEASFRAIINRSNDGAFADDILELDRGRPKGGILGRLMQEIPTNPQLAAETLESRLDDLKIHLTAVSREDAASDGMKKPLANHLKKLTPEQIDRIQNWYPADGLKVSYSIDGTRGSFRSIEQASPGQKTAAILAFILSDGTEPLILDQPEDDLDNRLIYDLVVKQIREIKSKRQVIIVTHNPNIVVNGDAEKVLEMSYRSGQCVVAERGTLQSQAIRDAICRVMEGGPEAFEKRYKRIALSKFVA